MGALTGARFTLKVSLRYAPEPGETDFLCELFRIASGILSDATDGRLSIGQLDIATASTGGADADIWIHPADTAWRTTLLMRGRRAPTQDRPTPRRRSRMRRPSSCSSVRRQTPDSGPPRDASSICRPAAARGSRR